MSIPSFASTPEPPYYAVIFSCWKQHLDHQVAQEAGKSVWYSDYHLRIARVERAYEKAQPSLQPCSD